jgi:hypothetical protein
MDFVFRISQNSCFPPPSIFFYTHGERCLLLHFFFLFGFCTTYGERCLFFPAPILFLIFFVFTDIRAQWKRCLSPPALYARLCVCVCVCVWVHACTRAFMRACVHACVSACMHVCVCACVHAPCVCVCVVGRHPNTAGRESIHTLSHPSLGGRERVFIGAQFSNHYTTVRTH